MRFAAAVLAAGVVYGQTFDAVSVKPAAGGRFVTSGGPGSREPGRVRFAGATLQYLLETAYDLQAFQIAGPGWLDTERFDVDAVLSPDATKEQFRAMLQNLLMARFQMKTHRESREMPGYALVALRNGARLQAAEDLGPEDPAEGAPRLELGKDGFFVPPRRPGVFLQLIGAAGARESFRQSTMRELADSLQRQLLRPVADATGLTGKYDFTLTFATEGLFMGRGRIPVGPGGGENLPDVFNALRSQLGLRLEQRKGAVETLVIEHVEKRPTEN